MTDLLAPMSSISMEETEKRVRQMSMYGFTVAYMKAEVEEALKHQDPSMLALSLLSDAQGESAMGMEETARQTINRAKWVISHYWKTAR